MSDNIDSDDPQLIMCSRCGGHDDDLKCLDEHVTDLLRPMQTKLYRLLNDETLPHAIRGEIVSAGDALGRAMQSAQDHTTRIINNKKASRPER